MLNLFIPFLLTQSGMNSRIVNGVTVPSVTKYPFMVSLGYGSYNHFCGGSLIASSWVLTAAHCIHGRHSFILSSGSVLLRSLTLSPFDANALTSNILEVVEHPAYNPQTLDYDYALLRINSMPVSPIDLISIDSNDDDNTNVTAMGWGTLQSGGSISNILMEVNISIDDSCGLYQSTEITANMICAGADNKDSCQGDSGGPLIVTTASGYEQVGVVSWGYGCALNQYPGVYARVWTVLNWIQMYMNENLTPTVPPSPISPPSPPTNPPIPHLPPSSPGICDNTCIHFGDSECDDGGAGAEFAECLFGTDCQDCGSRISYPPPSVSSPSTNTVICTDTCFYASDTDCDDGGLGSEYAICNEGSDCADCGPRYSSPPPPNVANNFYDCDGVFVGGYETWLGDGICHNGTNGVFNFNCESLKCDQCDCECPNNLTICDVLPVPSPSSPPPPSPPPSPLPPPPPPAPQFCTDDCSSYASDGSCDDGGVGSQFAYCAFGTDCSDCGIRYFPSPSPPPSPRPSPPYSSQPPPPSPPPPYSSPPPPPPPQPPPPPYPHTSAPPLPPSYILVPQSMPNMTLEFRQIVRELWQNHSCCDVECSSVLYSSIVSVLGVSSR